MYDIRWEEEPDVEEYRRLDALVKVDAERALAGFEALAARGSVASMLYLAGEYRIGGASVLKDLDRAKYWYEKAEQNGGAPASYMLGVVCSQLSQYDKAFAAFSRGAARNYLPAIYRLAMLHHDGLGTSTDINRCRTLLELAASRGHLFAKRDLATLFLRGRFGPLLMMRGISMLASLLFNVIGFCAKSLRRGPQAVIFDERVLA